MLSTDRVQNTGEWEYIHPNSSMPSKAIGTRLLRRLSNIFHFDNDEIGFFRIFPDGPGTQGSSQEAICQSPRIQRWRRFISTSYRSGYASYNCTSLSRPQR